MQDEHHLNVCREWLLNRTYTFVNATDDGELWERADTTNLFLFTTIVDSIQVKLIDHIVKYMQANNLHKAIKIYRTSTSSSVKNNKDSMPVDIELVCTTQLMCNILTHKYQPKMTKCSPGQVAHIKSLHLYAMPQLSSEDPVVRLMDWQKDDVIAICENKCSLLNKKGACCAHTRYRIIV